MSTDMNWIIGGLIPVHITPDAIIDNEKRTITLNCAAFREEMNGADPYTEIERFEAIASAAINNTTTYNAGSNLQVASTDPLFSVTNGVEIWDRCALHPPIITYDEFAEDFLLFQLIIEFEVIRGGGISVYEPPYYEYPNVEYYYFYDDTVIPVYQSNSGYENNVKDHSSEGLLAGTELGFIRITEDNPVSKVRIFGSGCSLPAAITVIDSKEGWINWTVGEVEGSAKIGGKPQVLEFNLPTPKNEIIIHTTPHTFPKNHGCYPIWIELTWSK